MIEQPIFENYGVYASLVQNNFIEINTSELDAKNINEHFYHILNILRDGVEDKDIQNAKVRVTFADDITLNLTIFDYWFNLIFWNIPVVTRMKITSKYLFFFPNGITKKAIKSYIDNLFIREYRSLIPFITMNNIIDDTIYKLKYINEFSLYLANTINLEDTLDLMKEYKEFNDAIHADLSGVPIDEVKNKGMEYANTMIKYIKNSNHCMRDSFISQEAVNPKQFKEVFANIGTKPNGQGDIFPFIINNSFINGGVADPRAYVIESSVGRVAQILQKMNVGTSGAFARLLEINNIDTNLHPNPDYSCRSKNYEPVYIKDASWLQMYDLRYYRMQENGVEQMLDAKKDIHLIGKTLLFRSPMTCASFAHGEGICRKCYGDLYFVMRNINPGKMASELLSSIYTQMLLSAKHLLESMVIKMEWTEGFDQLFNVTINTIGLIEDQDYIGYNMIINTDEIKSVDDDDDLKYNEYITHFEITCPDGTTLDMHTSDSDEIYISDDLNIALRSKKARYVENIITIPLTALKDLPAIFYMHVQNKELSRTLNKTKQIINKASETSKYNKDTILTELITTNTEGNIHLSAVHLEVLLANQIRSVDDILDKPNWEIKNVPYNILTLSSSLTNNPSITCTLEYQKIGSTLVSPLSTRKRKPSRNDVFFILQPQNYLDNTNSMVDDHYKMRDDEDDNDEPIKRPLVRFSEETTAD